MRYFSAILASVFMAFSTMVEAQDVSVLDYKAVVRLRNVPEPVETRLQLITTPPVTTRNKVKKPRFVGWRVKILPGQGGMPPASVMTRVRGLFYLEAPTSGIVPREGGVRFGNRFCRLWQAPTPPSVGAFVYLVEVAPDLLALSYLSASLPEGDLASIEIHLEGVSMAKVPEPAEEGMMLLRTLRSWGTLVEPEAQVMETEQIQ